MLQPRGGFIRNWKWQTFTRRTSSRWQRGKKECPGTQKEAPTIAFQSTYRAQDSGGLKGLLPRTPQGAKPLNAGLRSRGTLVPEGISPSPLPFRKGSLQMQGSRLQSLEGKYLKGPETSCRFTAQTGGGWGPRSQESARDSLFMTLLPLFVVVVVIFPPQAHVAPRAVRGPKCAQEPLR